MQGMLMLGIRYIDKHALLNMEYFKWDLTNQMKLVMKISSLETKEETTRMEALS
jgi:hypothetical protein